VGRYGYAHTQPPAAKSGAGIHISLVVVFTFRSFQAPVEYTRSPPTHSNDV
jgi:hypothetical protein